MFEPLDVPGYDVLAPLGTTGRTWKALAAAERASVVLRRVHGGEEVRRRLRQGAALWGSLAGGHVVPVRDVVSVEPDVAVVVSDFAPGGGLDALLARRGPLDDGEVVTLVVPLAETLADAHRRGFTHGRVSMGNVVLADDGRPMLSDATLASSDRDGVAADVVALVAVALAALGDRRTGPVATALAAPVRSADELATTVRAAAPACAIALHRVATTSEPVDVAVPSRSRRRAGVVGAMVATALVAGIVWGHRDNASATRMPMPESTAVPSVTPSAGPATSQPWRAIVQRLEQQRVRSYAASLRRVGMRPVGLHIRLMSVHMLTATDERAVIRVVDGWASYEIVGGGGHVVRHRPARARRVTTLVLRRAADGWRLQREVR